MSTIVTTLGKILTRDVLTTTPEGTLNDALAAMEIRNVSSVVVVEGNRPIGIFTHRDAVMLAGNDAGKVTQPIGTLMRFPLVVTTDINMGLHEAYRFMVNQGIRHLVVIDEDGILVGIATEGDFFVHLDSWHFSQMGCVESIMTQNIISAQSGEMLSTVFRRMAERGINHLVVGHECRVVGILTERDVARLLVAGIDTDHTSLGEVIVRPEHTVRDDKPVMSAKSKMVSLDVRYLLVTNNQGDWVGFISRDDLLTGQEKHYWRIIQENEAHFRCFFEDAPLPYQSLDNEGRLMAVNQVWEETFGCTQQDAVGRFIGDFLVPGQEEKLQSVCDDLVNFNEISGVELAFLCRDGNCNLMAMHGRIVHEKQKGGVHVHCILSDVTERRSAERKLRKSETLYKSLVEQIPALVYSAQLDDYSTTFYMSPQSVRITGYTQDDMENDPRFWDKALHPEDKERVLTAFADCHRTESQLSIEYRMQTKNGHDVWVHDEAAIVSVDDRRFLHGVVLDISTQKKAEQALRESELRFRSIFENAAAGMVMGTPDGHITEVNAAFAQMLGYHQAEMKGMTIREITHPDDWEANRIEIEAVNEGTSSTYHLEKRYMKRDGQPVWCLLSSAWVRDGEGNPALVIALVQNIDEKKKTEMQLSERFKEWTSLINAAPIGIGFVKDRVLQWASPKFLDMVGFSEENIVGRSSRFLYPDDEEFSRVGEEKYRQLKESNSGEIETRLQCKDGSVIDVLLRSSALDPGNLAAGVIFTALDISQRKQTEEALTLKTQELSALLNSIPSPVYFKDCQSRYQAVNKAFLEWVGLNSEQVIGKSDSDIFPEEIGRQYLRSDKQVFENRQEFHDNQQRAADSVGNIHWFSTSKIPVLSSEECVEGLVGISFDITESKLAEERKLKEEQALRKTLIHEVHHRIKNHLQGVAGLLRNLSMSDTSPKQCLDMAISQVRTIATVYGLQCNVDSELIQVSELLRACIDLHQNTSRNNIEFKVYEKQRCRLVREESVPIALVINELVTNALKHTPEHLSSHSVQVMLEGDDSSVQLFIRNRGNGLHQQSNLNKQMGTGLDLLRTLLPKQGARFSLYEDGGEVVAELILEHPVLWRKRADHATISIKDIH
ncbi:MAG: PAS domain S-box protein [Candidatus Thiodiazotropha sp. (ex Codakia rugifera)]|nr:PAS domain S-box protein [Candidatus Thiodiazotropha sp. (ex Codakia rugifera)]